MSIFLYYYAFPAKYLPEHRSGQRSISGDLQIIGGETAEPRKYIFLKLLQLVFKWQRKIDAFVMNIWFSLDAYPWQISLQMRQIGVFSHICGGSVIDESTIVCAAHCAVGKTESQVQVNCLSKNEYFQYNLIIS